MMFKKTLAIVLAIAMVMAMWVVPTQAAPSVSLPTGEHYDLTASEVEPFQAGDEVRVRLTVSEIYDDWSLMGLDLTILFDEELLEYTSATSSSDIINADYPDGEVKWELITNENNVDTGILLVTMLDDGDGWLGTSTDGAIWVELIFTAKKAGNGGDYLLHTSAAEGTENVDLETAYGNGVAVYVKGSAPTAAPTEDPTSAPPEIPTPVPTEAPTPVPTVSPTNAPIADAYSIKADDVEPFSTGDEVKIKLTIADLLAGESYIGFDWELAYDETKLTPVITSFTSSCADVNAANAGAAWELMAYVDDTDPANPVIKVTLLDDSDTYVGMTQNDALWVELVFTAVADGTVDDEILSTKFVAGTLNNDSVDMVYGNGVTVKVSAPAATPSPTPSPTPSGPALPSGAHYTLSADDVDGFSAGDIVKVKITVSDIKDDWSLMGLDLRIPYDSETLQLNPDDCTSSSEIINANYPGGEVKWEMILNTTVVGDLRVTMLDDGDGWIGTSEDGAIWIELSFTALKDSVAGQLLLYTSEAEGTENVNLDTAYGDGVAVYALTGVQPSATPVVTPEITATPVVTPEITATPVVTPEITATPVVTPEITATPVVTPEITATPVVTPVVTEPPVIPELTPYPETPVIPNDSSYALSADNVPSFVAGDTVKFKIVVSDISDGLSLLGLDWEILFNSDALQYVSATSSCEALNAADPEVAWEMLINSNTAGKLLVTFLEDGDMWKGCSEDGAIWAEFTFTALVDSNTLGSNVIAYTSNVDGCDANTLEQTPGSGVVILTDIGDVSVRPTATPVVTPEITATPVVTPEITATPDVTPEITPTIKPELTPYPEAPELPAGDAFKATFEDLEAFGEGEKVKVRLTISDIADNQDLKKIVIEVPYNTSVLESIIDEMEATVDGVQDSTTPNIDIDEEEGVIKITISVSEGEQGFNAESSAYIDLVFNTKVASSSLTSNVLGYTSKLTADDEAAGEVTGAGDYMLVDIGIQSEPTVEPTSEPTGDPTEPPVDNNGNTPTFDIGLVSLAAVALSTVTTIKRKKRS